MTMMPFKGRCHTCGHDHDSDEETFAWLRELMKPERDATIESQAAQIAALTAERGALREDAERYRHFKAHCTYMDYEERGFGALISPPIRRWYHDTNFTQHKSLDAAIDAARKDAKL